MAKPTMPKIKEANPGFFSAHNSRFFGDAAYSLKGFILTIKGQRETSDRRIVQESQQYVVHPDSLKIDPVARDRGNNRLYCFIDHNNGVLTQWLNEDGSPDGPPSNQPPNQHEYKNQP